MYIVIQHVEGVQTLCTDIVIQHVEAVQTFCTDIAIQNVEGVQTLSYNMWRVCRCKSIMYIYIQRNFSLQQ